MNTSLLVKNRTAMLVASANDIKDTNENLQVIISIISNIFISLVVFTGLFILCMCICGNSDIIFRIIKSCCYKCDCCDDDEYSKNLKRRSKIENESKITIVVLPETKVMDVY